MLPQLSILTATYNRAHLLPDLYASLCSQTCHNFIWVVIDDGSADETSLLLRKWQEENPNFEILWCKQQNCGKNRAISRGIQMVQTDYTMIIDSDDYLTDDAVEFVLKALSGISGLKAMAGISGLCGKNNMKPLNMMSCEYVDANNLERKQYGIDKDCCEVYRTDLLLSHPFVVWEGEKFTPEEVVWNQLALEGWKLRWFNKILCIVRYQESGLTKGSWGLLKNNPMGYAMMYNHQLLYATNFRSSCYLTIQMISCSILAHNIRYILLSHRKLLAIILFPVGLLLSIRRKMQFRVYT